MAKKLTHQQAQDKRRADAEAYAAKKAKKNCSCGKYKCHGHTTKPHPGMATSYQTRGLTAWGSSTRTKRR